MNTMFSCSCVKKFGLTLVWPLLLGLVFCMPVYAGGGKCEGLKFTLVISVRHDASPTRLNEWKNAFQQASELLFDATDGQHQFGTIFVCNKSYGGRNADIHLFEEDGRSYVNRPIPGLARQDCHMFLYGDERDKPFVIVHEFGHYGYGLYDEYTGPGGDAECVEAPSNASASIMEGGWWQAPGVDGGDGFLREISEFCVADNHDPDEDTQQEHQHGKSCWQTMNYYYPDLILPAQLPDEGPTTGADDIVWIELEPETRLVLCIDRSGSMDSPSWKMLYAKLGAQLFVDLVDVGDKIGVVSYASDVSADFPLSEVVDDATKTSAKAAIEGLSAAGATAMGAGLIECLNQMTSPGDTACQQAIILLSNGFQNTGIHPYEVIPDINNEMTKVFTVAIGDDVDEDLLQTIASETNGRYFRVRDPLDLLDAFGVLSMEIRDGGLVLNERSLIAQDERIERFVRIDNTDEGAVFEITWEGSDLDLTLEKPDGSVVDPGVAETDPDIEYVSTSNYEFYRIASPDEGEWTLVADGVEVSGQTAFTAQVLARNKTIFFAVAADEDQYEYPDPILIRAEARFGLPITGVEVSGIVKRPDDSRVPITLYDNGLATNGDEFAGDGRYSALFLSYSQDGSYVVELLVENTGDGTIVDGGEPLRPDSLGGPQVGPPVTVPLFRRWASTTVIVSGVPTIVDAIINIDPDVLNLWSQGQCITCYIELPNGYDVNDIDVSSILFNDYLPAEPSPYEVSDHDNDGISDLMVKFDRAEAQSLLAPGDSVEILVTGQVGAEMFAGMDTIRVIGDDPHTIDHIHNVFPNNILMLQNYPNPFGSTTNIPYALSKTSHVTLKIYSAAGQLITILVDQVLEPGYYTADWDRKDRFGCQVPSGVYFYRMEAHTGQETWEFKASKKMILLR